MFYNCPVRKLASHSPPSCHSPGTHKCMHAHTHRWTCPRCMSAHAGGHVLDTHGPCVELAHRVPGCSWGDCRSDSTSPHLHAVHPLPRPTSGSGPSSSSGSRQCLLLAARGQVTWRPAPHFPAELLPGSGVLSNSSPLPPPLYPHCIPLPLHCIPLL